MSGQQHEYLNVAGVVDRSTKPDCLRTSKKKKHDPYAIYDDENAGTHYFLVPATKDPQNFTRAFQELNNMPKSKTNIHAKLQQQHQQQTHHTSTSGYINDRNFRNCSTRKPRTKSCSSSSSSTPTRSQTINNTTPQIIKNSPAGRLKIPPPPSTTTTNSKSSSSSSQNTFPDFNRSEDDYCFIKADTKSTFQPSKSCPTRNQYLKREHYQEFKKILKKESMVHYTGGNTTINTNSSETECLKKKKLKSGDLIDACSCMLCVRSVSYKYTGNDDGDFNEPCSCQGSTKSIVGRYVCMGLIAVFLPCMLCYLPAKACCGSNRKWYKHSQDDTYVCYQSNNNKPV